MRNKGTIRAAGLALVGLMAVGAGCAPKASLNLNASAAANINVPPAMPAPRQLTVTLSAQGGSGIMGKAVLIEQENKTKVMLNLNGTTQGLAYPAHVHVGACPTPGEVKHALASLTEGKSVTLLDATFDSFVAGLPLAINVHKSEKEMNVYVACGDLLSTNVQDKDPGVESMMSSAASVKTGGEGTEAEQQTNVTLRAIGSLGVTGTATIKADDDKTKVSIKLNGTATGTYPAYLRKGMCPNPGEVKYALSNVVNGSSETTLDAKLADVMADGQMAIDLRESALATASILACGDLPLWDAVTGMFKI